MGGRISRKKTPALPAVPCALALVPIGACVRIAFPTGSSIDECVPCGRPTERAEDLRAGDWYQVTFKIGEGSRNLRALFVPPTDPRWAHSPDHCHFVSPDVVVLECAWPVRHVEADRAVADPVAGQVLNGPLFEGEK